MLATQYAITKKVTSNPKIEYFSVISKSKQGLETTLGRSLMYRPRNGSDGRLMAKILQQQFGTKSYGRRQHKFN